MRGVVWHGPNRAALIGGVSLLIVATSAATPSVAHAGGSKDSGGKTKVSGTTWGDKDADQAGKDSSGKNSASLDPGSLFTLSYAVRAREVWAMKDPLGKAVTGKGVTVALLDSGVEAVPGLNGPGKIVRGPDRSLE